MTLIRPQGTASNATGAAWEEVNASGRRRDAERVTVAVGMRVRHRREDTDEKTQTGRHTSDSGGTGPQARHDDRAGEG